jgi:hypothetical protein
VHLKSLLILSLNRLDELYAKKHPGGYFFNIAGSGLAGIRRSAGHKLAGSTTFDFSIFYHFGSSKMAVEVFRREIGV